MPNERRINRLQQLILEVAGETLQREVRDPRMGLATFTRVQLTKDLSVATLYWSCLEEEGARRRTEQGMESATALLQRRVAEALTTRVTPRLELRFDPTLEQAQRLETIFHRLREERGDDDEDEGDDDSPPDEASEPEERSSAD